MANKENQELRGKLESVLSALADFQKHLHSDKFTGVAHDGRRKDWIATKDVLTRLQEIKNLI